MLAIILQIIFIVLFLVFFVFFIVQFFNIFFRGYAPFIATRRRVIKNIISELDLPPKAVVIELGSGRAGFLRALRKKYQEATLIGIEYSFMPLLISRIQNSFANARLILRKQNIFKVDISQADMIYCYLNDTTMEALEKKFQNECKPGALVVSYQFHLPNMKPMKEIKENKGRDRIYFYEF